ncbi:unnamed protein product [Adineta steineri]|uniref:Uncharacterized protein n=1 Tax=Adineta steineri TaxID=433720 RepID=A0A814K8X5_9BILA|nr:unnamed protein product [Adineta steineri]
MEPSTLTIHDNNPVIPLSQDQQQKPSLTYLALSVGDHQHSDLMNYKDPLFYQQPLHFHYNQIVPSSSGLGYETGDRIQPTNDIKFNKYHKIKSKASCQHGIERYQFTHRRLTKIQTPPFTIRLRPRNKLAEKILEKNLLHSRLNIKRLVTSKPKQIKKRIRGNTKLNIRSPVNTSGDKNVQHSRKRRSTKQKTQFRRCTSKTLSKID